MVKPHCCLIFCVLYEVHVQCIQIYEVVYGRRFSSLIAAEGRDVPPRETSFSGDERGKTSAVRRLRSSTFLTFESVNEILKCDHSNESYRAVLSYGTICFAAFYKVKSQKFFEFSQWLNFWQ